MTVSGTSTAFDLVQYSRNQFDGIELSRSLFLNTVPKCGTILLRNILLMFTRLSDICLDEFVVDQNIQRHQSLFDPPATHFLWGHVCHSDEGVRIMSKSSLLILVRDPYDYVLSYTRFIYSTRYYAPFARYARIHKLPVERVISFVIFGNGNSELYFEGLRDAYLRNAVAWLGAKTTLVRYEDLIWSIRNLDSPEAETYWRTLIKDCGFVSFPGDWRERIRAGSDPMISSTARGNLDIPTVTPTELTELQRAMVETAAPGIRALLGYKADPVRDRSQRLGANPHDRH